MIPLVSHPLPAEPPQGLTAEQWKRVQLEVAKRRRRAKYAGLVSALHEIGYLAQGAAIIVLAGLAAVLIGWWFDL